jgi:hypothetical protein
MSVIHLHHDELKDFGSVVTRAFGWLKTMHQAIVRAKRERLENELVVRRGYGDEASSDRDAVRYPQAPLVLSEKWDF